VALGFAALPVVHAQSDFDRAVREVDRIFRKEVEKELRTPPKKPDIEEEREKKKAPEALSFLAEKITLIGTESYSPEDFQIIIGKYEGKEVDLNDLNILCREIERDYLKKGIITACFVPPQEVRDGTVILQVVESKMGDLDIQDSKYLDEDILKFYWTIKPGQVLRYDKMSRCVYLMNKNPDRTVKATLYAGKKPGTTDVRLDAETRFPVHVTGSFDREGVVSTGKERWGAGVRHNNFLFVDDTLISGVSLGQDFYGVYGYHSVPITNMGTSIMYGVSYSEASPKKEFTDLGLKSVSQAASLFVHQDIFRKADYKGEVYFGFEAKDKTTWVYDGTTNRNRLRILTFGSNLIHEYPGTITYINPEFSQGINGFGARGKSPLSSREADNTFSIFNLNINHIRALPLNLRAAVKFKCQIASEILPSQEEFSLGGIDSVRGYPSGDYLADNAFQTNFELQIPAFFIPEDIRIPYDDRPLKDNVTGVAFFDYGYGQKRGDRSTEQKDDSLAGLGVGVRLRVFKLGVIRLEWGFPVGDKPLTETAPGRFHISIDFQY
jgi:hemolysin activation/secretion protein